MKIDLSRIQTAAEQKKAGTKIGPGVELAGCPDKIEASWFAAAKDLIVLRRPSWSHRQIPQLRQDARHLHPIQLRHERQNLRDELIFHQLADFVLTVLFSATQQFRHGHLQGSRQPFQRRQRRRSFLVFNFRNVSARHGHASRQLPLAQPAAQSKRADRRGQVQVSPPGSGHGHHHCGRKHHRLGLWFLVQRRVAAPAVIIHRTELNQQAVIATDDFP